MKAITKGAHEREILESLTNGKNTYLRMDRLESSSFDKTWIEVIEGVIFDLGEIVGNPRMNTKTEGNIVPVELARKTNAESVQHLASHTQYIKEIDDLGNVVPSKILTIMHDDDIKTYENRFIATLIRRLVLFVEKRYEVVAKLAELHDEEVLMIKNKSFVDGSTVEIETKIKISHKNEDPESLKTTAYIERIKKMRTYLLYFYNSPFMHKLKTEKDVHNPILQTNIIRKNPKYHHCYEVYRFIESYDRLGVNYKVDEQYSLFNDEELKELNRTLFANYITLKGKDRSKNAKVDTKIYKPRILTSADDEAFIYGPLLSGPIEFVRTDALYQEYLNSKIRSDLPLHPTKKEKEYFAEEYKEKSELRQDEKQKEDLIKRVNKEIREFEKLAAKIEQERKEAEEELLRRQKETIKTEESDMLTEAREELIAQAEADQREHEEELARQEREFLESIKPPVLPVEMSHPVMAPVSYEQAVEEIWPQINRVPAPQPYEPNPEYPIEDPVIPVPMSHPMKEPVSYAQAVEEIWPNINNVPEPHPYEPEPRYEDNIKPAVIPVPMSHPQKEPISYEGAVEEIWPNINNIPEPQPYEPNPEYVEPQPQSESKPLPQKTKIPGKYILLTEQGYYISKTRFSPHRKDARIFDDFRIANGIRKIRGGKVIKL